MKLPSNIKEVLTALDDIIDETVKENNKLGVFAYVYRRTTAKIEEAILEGRFEDNARMEKMDVAFANLYIKAYRDYKLNKPVSAAWKVSFDAGRSGISIVQHIMLGMNAHINLDLGQAAAIAAPGNTIHALKNDFMEVNKVLAELTDIMQKKLGSVSPLMFLLDWIGQRSDEKLINFSMVKARDFSWRLAEDLSPLSDQALQDRIALADQRVGKLAGILAKPPGILLGLSTRVLSLFEEKDVAKIIRKLRLE
ncbi:MAG: DUF5995 family protein [bacterium]|jgi:hypothetical protein